MAIEQEVTNQLPSEKGDRMKDLIMGWRQEVGSLLNGTYSCINIAWDLSSGHGHCQILMEETAQSYVPKLFSCLGNSKQWRQHPTYSVQWVGRIPSLSLARVSALGPTSTYASMIQDTSCFIEGTPLVPQWVTWGKDKCDKCLVTFKETNLISLKE